MTLLEVIHETIQDNPELFEYPGDDMAKAEAILDAIKRHLGKEPE